MHLRPLFFFLVLNLVAIPSFAGSIRLEDISSAPAKYFSLHPDVNSAATASPAQELLAPITSIPEPSGLLLTGAGVVVLARRLTRRRQASARRPRWRTGQ